MRDVAAAIVPWATIAFAVSSMLAAGMGFSTRGMLAPLREWRQVLGALVTNFVLAPALAFLLMVLLDLDRHFATGLFIVGSAAGAPFLLKLAQVARTSETFAASLLLLLLPATVLVLPFAVTMFAPGVEVSAGAIAMPLVLSMLLPLALGTLLRQSPAREFAVRVAPFFSKLATVALLVLFVAIVIADWDEILGIGLRAIAAAVAFILGAFGIGWLVGSQTSATRDAVALGTAQRNIGAATVVATQSFASSPGVVVMVTAVAAVGMVVLFPIAFAMRSGAPRRVLRKRHA